MRLDVSRKCPDLCPIKTKGCFCTRRDFKGNGINGLFPIRRGFHVQCNDRAEGVNLAIVKALNREIAMLESRSFLAILALISVGGCAIGPTNQSYWVNPHINQSMLEQRLTIDKAECQALAYRYIPAPPAAQPRPSGTFQMTTPSGPVYGTYGGGMQNAPAYSMNDFYRDRNRADYARACMAERGWQKQEMTTYLPSPLGSSCDLRRECVNGLVCIGNICQTSVPHRGMECDKNADCGSGRTCRSKSGGGTQCVDR